MDIRQCYRILNVSPDKTDAEIASSYKKLAFKYHPDRNKDKIDKAHEAMTTLNIAYSTLMSYRFQHPGIEEPVAPPEPQNVQPKRRPTRPSESAAQAAREQEIEDDYIFKLFVKLRDDTKEQIYKYFQYNLYNLLQRDGVYNQGIYKRIVINIRKSYHGINALETRTSDMELLEHFAVFKKMIFTFYTASECLNINDNYSNQYDVDAYRLYRKGDDALTKAMKELFYDRHNRGFIKRELIMPTLLDAQYIFISAINGFQGSTWIVETKIKLECTDALISYYKLFFTE